MPPEDRYPTNPRLWMRRARSNLARARAGRVAADILYEDLCFDAQQAAEKAVKAVLASRNADFPKSHSVSRLLDIVEQCGVRVPAAVRESAALTTYATDARYPGASEDVDESEYRDAVRLAEVVVQWANANLPGDSR